MEEMEIVLETLRSANRKLREDEIASLSGLSYNAIDNALHRLLLRRLVRCDSFDPSKRGGQAGVRRWGVSHFTPLWEAVDELEK